MTISKGGISLTDLDLWAELGGPKRKSQWVAGRSAMEVARAWIGAAAMGRMPAEVEAALTAHSAFGPVLEWHGEPEVKLPFDTFRGEPRNTDMLVHARDRYGAFVVAVEGKADESFGETVGEALGAALERQLDSDGRFLVRLSQGLVSTVGDRGMVGPFHVPGQPLFSLPLDLYVAKAIRNLR